MDLDEFEHYIAILQMLKIVYNKTGNVLYPNEVLCNDLEYEIYIEALHYCTPIVNEYYDQEDEVTKWVFCDDQMTEFYNLCKEYGRRHHIPFKDNPFVRKAQKEVNDLMNSINDYSYNWWIKIGTRHKFASSLYFYAGCEFIQTCLAVEAIYKVFDYYTEALKKIKKELTCTALTVYRPQNNYFTERKAA